MAKVIVTLEIMPNSPEADLGDIEQGARKEIEGFSGETDVKVEKKPVAFGLKSLNITFVMNEDKGDTEELENKIADLDGVNSVKVADVRRTLG